MNAVIYARAATDEESENNLNLRIQERLLKEYCTTNDIKIIKHFKEVCSGRIIEKLEWQNLITFIEEENVEKILITSWNRLGRNFNEVSNMSKRLSEKNIEIISIDKTNLNLVNFLITNL